MPRYAAIVPAVRTIPGVDVFDYAIPEGFDVAVGDLVPIPFRSSLLPGLVMEIRGTSDVAAKVKPLKHPPILRLGPAVAILLRHAAERTFSALPTVLGSWIGHFPKRIITGSGTPIDARPTQGQAAAPPYQRVLADRLHHPDGLIAQAKSSHGRTLILVPWQHRAEIIANELDAGFIHGGLADGAAWDALEKFLAEPTGILVTTRRGAWLAAISDTVFVDEPENDEHKQEEQSPRLDARWIVAAVHALRPSVRIEAFATTPRLQAAIPPPAADLSDINILFDPWKRGHRSDIPEISPTCFSAITEAIEERNPVIILHPIDGDVSRLSCADCKWTATCATCGFSLSTSKGRATCKSCGRKEDIPEQCPTCGGTDLSRGRTGIQKLTSLIERHFSGMDIRIRSPLTFDAEPIPPKSLVLVTDLSRLGSGVEDIRRTERLAIAWRRVVAHAATAEHLIAQGPTDTVEQAKAWLTSEGMAAQWTKELSDRASFAYPPAAWTIKFLVDGTADHAKSIQGKMQATLPHTWQWRGPYPVAFRAATRKPRHVIHALPGLGTTEASVRLALKPFARLAFIDLDPVSFFC